MVKAGTIIHGPDGMAYEILRDIRRGENLTPWCVRPIGGAPEPEIHQPIPEWLWEGLHDDR